jgi:hypothetical protein
MIFKSRLEARLLKARDAWMEVMSGYRDERGLVCPPIPPMLNERHLENCRLVESRDRIMEYMPAGRRIAEVGVLAGDFSVVLLEKCAPAELHLVDLDLESRGIRRRFSSEIASGQVMLHQGNSSRVLRKFPDHHFDFIYIDADHSYEGVRKDIMVAKRKIGPDGYLIFNDYTYWSPVECIPYGVMHAVNELCLDEDWQVAYFALDPYMYCDVAIRRI